MVGGWVGRWVGGYHPFPSSIHPSNHPPTRAPPTTHTSTHAPVHPYYRLNNHPTHTSQHPPTHSTHSETYPGLDRLLFLGGPGVGGTPLGHTALYMPLFVCGMVGWWVGWWVRRRSKTRRPPSSMEEGGEGRLVWVSEKEGSSVCRAAESLPPRGHTLRVDSEDAHAQKYFGEAMSKGNLTPF